MICPACGHQAHAENACEKCAMNKWTCTPSKSKRGRRSDLHLLEAVPSHTAAYLAGIFDGEGCVYITVRARRYLELHVTIASTTMPFLRALHAEAGSPGTVSFRARNGTRGKKPIGAWHMAGKTAAVFLAVVRPWVRMKRENITTALEFYALRYPGGGGRTMPFSHATAQMALATQLRVLNALTGRSKPFKYNPLLAHPDYAKQPN